LGGFFEDLEQPLHTPDVSSGEVAPEVYVMSEHERCERCYVGRRQ